MLSYPVLSLSRAFLSDLILFLSYLVVVVVLVVVAVGRFFC